MNIYKKIRIKLLKQLVVQINTRLALSTKNRTYYETLGITPNATHNEIKSAYYKLSLVYHPDKNKNDSAKQMFQQISDAYTVLGNYKSRKQYDRNIAVGHGRVNAVHKPMYKQDITRPSTPPNHKIYDFDEWTRAHYHRTFEKDQERKWRRERFKETKLKETEPNPLGIIFFIVFMCSALGLSIRLKREENYDISLNEKKK